MEGQAQRRSLMNKAYNTSGGEGGIRTRVGLLRPHPISSRRRYDRFGTSPGGIAWSKRGRALYSTSLGRFANPYLAT